MTLLSTHEIEDLTAKARQAVQRELTQAFGDATLDQFTEVTDTIEDLLLTSLDRIMREHPKILSPNCAYQSTSSRFIIDGQHYVLNIGPSLSEWQVLEVVVLPVARLIGRDDYTICISDLTTSGKYRQVRVSIPPGSQVSIEAIGSMAEAVFGTGCRWLEETAKDLASQDASRAGHDLYRMIRELLPDQRLTEELWLVAFSGPKGCYLLDREPTDHAIFKLSTNRIGGNTSPLSLVSNLLTTVLNYTEAHSKFAIERMQCIDVSLNESVYSDSKAQFLEAEKVIFGSPHISIFPILAAEIGQLVAVFPSRHRRVLEPFLEESRAALSNRFLLSRDRINKLISALSRPRGHSNMYGKLGEFLGGFFSSLVNS